MYDEMLDLQGRVDRIRCDLEKSKRARGEAVEVSGKQMISLDSIGCRTKECAVLFFHRVIETTQSKWSL
jgi:hypothetical protein